MALVRFLAFLQLLLYVPQPVSADEGNDAFPKGALVVAIVGQFPPIVIEPKDSGYEKRLIVHPGKRGKVIGTEPAPSRGTLVRVQWDEQIWQEWTNPGNEAYLDNNKYFMAQTGKWIKWKSFPSTIHAHNLKRVEWLPGNR
ncbi:MAG TPA: hypothetical protein VMT02_07520 [Burkholderiales bacterium]|jgi:hypothetical protein|nr:hypothetical protein [Burkholderiales bacterium]